MDRNQSLVARARGSFARRLARLPSRARNLPSNTPRAFEASPIVLNRSRLSRVLLWIALSLLTGYWAQNLTSSDARTGWEQAHHPSPQIARSLFALRGFEEIRDPKLSQKLLRTLPAQLGAPGEIWWAETPEGAGAALASVQALDSGEPIKLFCHSPCSNGALTWQKLGVGWSALEDVLVRIDSLLEKRKKSTVRTPTRQEARDPRELRY